MILSEEQVKQLWALDEVHRNEGTAQREQNEALLSAARERGDINYYLDNFRGPQPYYSSGMVMTHNVLTNEDRWDGVHRIHSTDTCYSVHEETLRLLPDTLQWAIEHGATFLERYRGK